ncbi:MAG: CSLREA domain-containing protein [bacterium]|nr:CSLREA domain-containing protein [bacterium]
MIMPGKKLMRWVIAASLITVFPVYASVTTTIVVNTTADEDGTNPAACSLREAVASVNTKTAVGGCGAGSRTGDNLIQLGAGIYNLTHGEIKIDSAVTIAGKDTARPDEVNPQTGQKPNRLRPDNAVSATVIHAAPGTLSPAVAASRIFTTSANIALRDVVLQGNYPSNTAVTPASTDIDAVLTASELAAAAVHGNGGIIYAGAAVSLDNVIISNAYVYGSAAAYSGGAIYLSTSDAGLSLSDVTFRHNRANGSGGAVAMVCLENGRLATHSLSMSRVLFDANRADAGAGAIDACGATDLIMSSSTLSANRSIPSGALPTGAIAYNQSQLGTGSVSLSFITAAEHTLGPVLSLSGLVSISLNHSVLMGNASNCQLASLPAGTPTNDYNVTESADTSCSALLSSASGNQNASVTASLSDELMSLANRGGLVDGYLPKASSQFVLNKGGIFDNCSAVDQRGLVRRSGSACDNGALERMEVTATDDTGDSRSNTDRLVIVDVLANDFFGESDFGPNKYAEPAVVVDVNPNQQCKWIDAANTEYPDHPEYKNHLVIQSKVIVPPGITPVPSGVLTGATPIQCKYHVVVVINEGSPAPALPTQQVSAQAIVSANVKNMSPNAVNDSYVRPVGVTSITINPIENDNDDGDGIFGKPAQWAAFPLYIAAANMPQLGKIEGTKGRCADYTATNPKLCYAVPITYVATNNLAPFTDSFKYSVFDKDGAASVDATVTIKTDAPNPDKGQGGSLDIVGGLALVLLGLRRTRRL